MQTLEIGTANLDVDMRTYESFEDAKLLAQEILSNRLDANVGCALIASTAAKLGYPKSLEIFFALAHDQSGHERVGISAVDCVDDIFVACRVLLESSINEHDV
ncbi:hypothetical protein GTP41_26085 [Pseudoduganella sp. DS3]|uniref:Uncharacterized protein n=1 Tax=Pseudoduganella guangdongensis TaxID=2692179 RepID=A0A6N9HQ74_9BURK|nr:hypothetical protein [Pseudoduganella guangdongensis]MYN05566.1 hypothetical protein [Pseudoduganella guangdongensis]